LVTSHERDIYLVLTQNIPFFLILSLSKFVGKEFLSLLSPFSRPLPLFSSPIHSKTYSSQRLSLCYGTFKIKEQVEASYELVLQLYHHKERIMSLGFLVKEALGWN
jgi:hypothetical protein